MRFRADQEVVSILYSYLRVAEIVCIVFDDPHLVFPIAACKEFVQR
jgi:hypothetical protein